MSKFKLLDSDKDALRKKYGEVEAEIIIEDFKTNAVKPLESFTYEDFKNLPDPEWIVEGWLEEEAYGFMYGSAGSGKSFSAIDMLCCIATGLPWHGMKVKKGKVVYIFGEGKKGIRKRIDAWLAANPKAKASDIVKNLVLVPKVPHVTNIVDKLKLIATADGAVLVCIDTHSRATRGLSETSAQDTSYANEFYQQIRDRAVCAVMVLHHSGKDGMSERGVTSLRDDSDFMIAVKRDPIGKVIVAQSKMKDEADDLYFVFNLKINKEFKSCFLEVDLGGSTTVPFKDQQQKQGIRTQYVPPASGGGDSINIAAIAAELNSIGI